MGKKVASASKKAKSKRAQKPMDEKLIAAYVSRLETALGNDDKFLPIVDELSTVAVAELVAIASRFVAPMAASSPRQKAIDRILKRHQSLISFKRKQKAVGGRSAA